MAEIRPPESLVPTVIPDHVDRPDPTQEQLAPPDTVAPPPEITERLFRRLLATQGAVDLPRRRLRMRQDIEAMFAPGN